MGKSKLLPGYTYLGKSSGERYRDLTGKEISRYEFNNRAREARGFISRKDQERLSKNPDSTYRAWLDDVSTSTNLPHKKIARYDSEFNQLYAEFQRSPKDKTPDGPLSRILVLAGYRRPEADYNVGDTP